MLNILIEASNINKVYDPDIYLKRGKNFYALSNVNFVLSENDFTCIMGPSGSGKSTLLNCLSTLDTITSGSISIMDNRIETMTKNQLCQFRYEYLGFIFQDHNLIPYLSIFDNIATPALLAKEDVKSLKNRVMELARELEIEDLLDKFPNECSGGECQRVAIARALINNPKILFCDEPTGNLDSKNSHKVLKILSRLNRQGTSIILVTHDAMIASYGKTMMYLYDGGIQTVIHKNDGSQVDFFKKISEITMQDSLLKEFSDQDEVNNYIQEPTSIQEEKIETVHVEQTKKDFLARQTVYMYIENQPYDKDLLKRNTPCLIKDTTVQYRNIYNDEMSFDLSSIKEIKLNLKARFVNFGLFSQYTFQNYVDFVCDEGAYLFKLKNQDDFIQLIQYFHKLDIPIDDPRNIEEAYHKYPRELERCKFFQRTHKDLIQYGAYDSQTPFDDYKKKAINKKKGL